MDYLIADLPLQWCSIALQQLLMHATISAYRAHHDIAANLDRLLNLDTRTLRVYPIVIKDASPLMVAAVHQVTLSTDHTVASARKEGNLPNRQAGISENGLSLLYEILSAHSTNQNEIS